MAFVSLSQDSAGAPALSGTNGTLCTVLDWALPQAGWAIEYTNGANARVYRPATGNRHRLHVNHDSVVSGAAYLATIRGCENASSATDLVDPFPTVAQVTNANSTVCVSTAAGATARPYRIVAIDTFLLMAISTTSGNTAGWDLFFFGDAIPRYAGDIYGTVIHVGNTSSSSTSSRAMSGCLSSNVASGKTFWCRSIDGFSKSTYGCLHGSAAGVSAQSMCNLSGTPTMRGGYLAQIVREKLAATCIGSPTTTPNAPTTVTQRGWLPWLWSPLHTGIGPVTSDDVFGDAAYHAAAQFMTVPATSSMAAIIELTNTWSAPSG